MNKVTIIIPHYNSVKSAIRLLESIYYERGTAELIKTIVVDDRSSDDITELKEKISSLKNVKFLINDTPSKGAGACRNLGLKEVKSEWLIFADADDYFEKGLKNRIIENNNSPADIIYFKCTSVEEDTGEVSNRHVFLNEMLSRYNKNKTIENERYLKFNWIVPWGKMIKSSIVIENNLKFDEIMVSNDVMFSIKLGVHVEEIEVANDTLYCVTKSTGSLTTSISKKNYEIRTNVILEKNIFLRQYFKKDELKKLDNYSMRWLLDGYSIYKLKMKELIKYFVLFRKNEIPFLPPISKFKKINKLIKDTRVEKKYRSLDNNEN